jgi:hypothetical protein
MQLPFMQNYADRTIGNCFSFPGGGNLAEARRTCLRYAPQSEEQPFQSVPDAVAWRAQEPPLAVSRVRAFTRACSRQAKFGLRKIAQPAEGKRVAAQRQT